MCGDLSFLNGKVIKRGLGDGRKGKWAKQGIKKWYLFVPIPHKIYKHYILQACISKKIA